MPAHEEGVVGRAQCGHAEAAPDSQTPSLVPSVRIPGPEPLVYHLQTVGQTQSGQWVVARV